MGKRRVNLSGKTFGQWKVGKRLPGYPTHYECTCLGCGDMHLVRHGNLQSHATKSCIKCAGKARQVKTGEIRGSKMLVERHGSLAAVKCLNCGKYSDMSVHSFLRGDTEFCAYCVKKQDYDHGEVLATIGGKDYRMHDITDVLGISRQRCYILHHEGRLVGRLEEALELLKHS